MDVKMHWIEYLNEFDEDAGNEYYNPKMSYVKKGERKTGRAYRQLQKKNKNKRLRQMFAYGLLPYPWYIEHDYVDRKKKIVGTYFQRPNRSNKRKFYKQYSNRIVRKYTLPIKGNNYRKCFDYWGTML